MTDTLQNESRKVKQETKPQIDFTHLNKKEFNQVKQTTQNLIKKLIVKKKKRVFEDLKLESMLLLKVIHSSTFLEEKSCYLVFKRDI